MLELQCSGGWQLSRQTEDAHFRSIQYLELPRMIFSHSVFLNHNEGLKEFIELLDGSGALFWDDNDTGGCWPSYGRKRTASGGFPSESTTPLQARTLHDLWYGRLFAEDGFKTGYTHEFLIVHERMAESCMSYRPDDSRDDAKTCEKKNSLKSMILSVLNTNTDTPCCHERVCMYPCKYE